MSVYNQCILALCRALYARWYAVDYPSCRTTISLHTPSSKQFTLHTGNLHEAPKTLSFTCYIAEVGCNTITSPVKKQNNSCQLTLATSMYTACLPTNCGFAELVVHTESQMLSTKRLNPSKSTQFEILIAW